MNKYWNWVDYSAAQWVPGTTPDKTYDDYVAFNQVVDDKDGTYSLIKNVVHTDGINRPEIYYWLNGDRTLVWKSKGTIELSEEMWNQSKFGHGYDATGFDITPWDSGSSNSIGKLFDLLREKVFVGSNRHKYNTLWFSCLNQAVTQNTTDDFAFKTTYVKLRVNHPLLTERDTYENYDITPVEEFVNIIKPFHTKLHTSMRKTTFGEANLIEVEETQRNQIITMRYNDHTVRDWEGDVVLLGGELSTDPDNTDSMEFTTVDNDIEYIYNGNDFDQPHEEGWGEELYPVDYTENISINVQTNASGSELWKGVSSEQGTGTISGQSFQGEGSFHPGCVHPGHVHPGHFVRKVFIRNGSSGACSSGACSSGPCSSGTHVRSEVFIRAMFIRSVFTRVMPIRNPCSSGARSSGACSPRPCSSGTCSSGACSPGTCSSGARSSGARSPGKKSSGSRSRFN